MFFRQVQICEDFGLCTQDNRLHKVFINIVFFFKVPYVLDYTLKNMCFMMIGCESITNKQTHFCLQKDLPDKVRKGVSVIFRR